MEVSQDDSDRVKWLKAVAQQVSVFINTPSETHRRHALVRELASNAYSKEDGYNKQRSDFWHDSLDPCAHPNKKANFLRWKKDRYDVYVLSVNCRTATQRFAWAVVDGVERLMG